MFLLVSFASCWGTKTHHKIGENTFRILSNDKPEGANFFFFFAIAIIVSYHSPGLVDPDWTEKAAGTHYYVWPGECENTGQYFKNAFISLSKESART